MGNTIAIACKNKLGGTRFLVLSNLVADLGSYALERGMPLGAEHFPGKRNNRGDQESRIIRTPTTGVWTPLQKSSILIECKLVKHIN